MIAKLIKLLERFLEILPPKFQKILFQLGIGISALAAIFAIYQGIVSGQKAAQPVGIQMAKSTADLLSDQTNQIRQKEFNRKDSQKYNFEYLDDTESIQPNFQYKLKHPETLSYPDSPKKYQSKNYGKFYDYDKLQPIENDNYTTYEDQQEYLRKEYSKRLLSRQKGLLIDYDEISKNDLPANSVINSNQEKKEYYFNKEQQLNTPYTNETKNQEFNTQKEKLKNSSANKDSKKNPKKNFSKEKGTFKYQSPVNKPLILE
jgi:hypothetical protein